MNPSPPEDLEDSETEMAKGFLPPLVPMLHEHTTQSIREHETLQQFATKFLSAPQIICRHRASQILQAFGKNSGCQLSIEISQVLTKLRRIVEDLYRHYCNPEVRSTIPFINDVGTVTSDLQRILYKVYYNPSNFDTFDRFGGVFAILDVLFVDQHSQECSSPFSNIPQWNTLLEVTLLLIDRLIHFFKDVKEMFLQSSPLLNLLAQIYRRCVDKDSSMIRNTIANSFKSLVMYDQRCYKWSDADFRSSRIVEYLTVNAIKWQNTKSSDIELVNSLEALSALTESNPDCQVDFLAVAGSMDMLIDVFENHRGTDWNWTIGYWAYDMTQPFKDERERQPKLGFVNNFIHDHGPVGNYYLAEFMLSSPNLIRFCWSLTIVAAILGRYLFLLGTVLFFSPPGKGSLGWLRNSIGMFPQINEQNVAPAIIPILLTIILFARLSFKTPRKLYAVGDMIHNLDRAICNNPGALWRFRQRDAYQIITPYLYIWDITGRGYHLEKLRSIQNHPLHRKPETAAEKRRTARFRATRKVALIRRCIDMVHRAWIIWTIWCIP